MQRILITGGAGFVGSSIALAIRRERPDAEVVALDNLRRRGSELNLRRLQHAGVRFIHGDIRIPSDLAQIDKANLIIECSAEPSALAGHGTPPSYAVDSNLTGAYHCLEWARRHDAAVLFLSSSRVYPIPALNQLAYSEGSTRFELLDDQPVSGASARGIDETFPLQGHRSLYGATKLCAELLIAEYAQMYGVPAIVNRCGLIAGPWQMGKIDQGVVVYWLASHIYGRPLRYIGYGGEGKQVRDVLHVDDLYELMLVQIETISNARAEIYNVGGGAHHAVSLFELTAIAQELTGVSMEIGIDPQDRPGDIPLYISDNSKIAKTTGWRPTRGVQQTCEDIVRWIREYEALLRPILAGN